MIIRIESEYLENDLLINGIFQVDSVHQVQTK